jgi:hypothetical protein
VVPGVSKTIQFSIDDDDYPVLLAWAKKKGFRTVSNMARRGTFALMERTRMGRHDNKRGAVCAERSDGQKQGQP